MTIHEAAHDYAIKMELDEDYYKFAVNDFKAGANWQKEQDKWINVNDKLPALAEFVLIYNTEGATLIGRLMSNGWFAFFMDGEAAMNELTATHWKYLPEPPKK